MQMVGSFGPRLREERERKELSLQAIADETKIKVSLLEGLEQDDLSFWPTGLFRRAYVRSYARAIGLDPERTLREFLEKFPEPVEPELDDPIRSPRDLLSSPIATVSSLLRRGSHSAPVPALSRPPAPVNGGSPPAKEETSPAAAVIEETIPEPSLLEMSELCTRLGRLSDLRGLPALLEDAARVLDAIGLVVWCWDARTGSLKAGLANGYSAETIAHLPAVPADAPNAVATAFRSGEACLVPGDTGLTAAVAVPVLAPTGCVGVLAIEVHNGCEQFEWIRAFAAILAAQLASFLGTAALAEAVA
jgi:transcriptional regulator with XRE-family HTH domain